MNLALFQGGSSTSSFVRGLRLIVAFIFFTEKVPKPDSCTVSAFFKWSVINMVSAWKLRLAWAGICPVIAPHSSMIWEAFILLIDLLLACLIRPLLQSGISNGNVNYSLWITEKVLE